jgi:hypothetical protein
MAKPTSNEKRKSPNKSIATANVIPDAPAGRERGTRFAPASTLDVGGCDALSHQVWIPALRFAWRE